MRLISAAASLFVQNFIQENNKETVDILHFVTCHLKFPRWKGW